MFAGQREVLLGGAQPFHFRAKGVQLLDVLAVLALPALGLARRPLEPLGDIVVARLGLARLVARLVELALELGGLRLRCLDVRRGAAKFTQASEAKRFEPAHGGGF